MTPVGTLVAAEYGDSPIAQYQGNPLIEALPPIRSEADAAPSMALFPDEPGDETQLSKEVRLHCIDRLLQLVQPLPIHLERTGNRCAYEIAVGECGAIVIVMPLNDRGSSQQAGIGPDGMDTALSSGAPSQPRQRGGYQRPCASTGQTTSAWSSPVWLVKPL
jgi:hypothetical protein